MGSQRRLGVQGGLVQLGCVSLASLHSRSGAPAENALQPRCSVEVAELQGLYGPFSFPERLLQKIWLNGDFDRAHATLLDGRAVGIAHCGRWNLLGGPDFKNARLRLGGERESLGDVELHLHASDWAAHKHADDPAYDRVVLHVVLFPPEPGHLTRGRHGEIPVLVLLPLLHHDLEEYAAEAVVEGLANRPASQIVERLGSLSRHDLLGLLERHAEARWRQKVHFARLRIRRLGWGDACHQTALEIMGYRFNRAPMLRLAAVYPLRAWAAAEFALEEALLEERSGWRLQGLRPANRPRQRLAQYARWARTVPDWPERLAALAKVLPPIVASQPTGEVRRKHRLTALRLKWAETLCGGAVGGTRFENLVCDGFLPLLCAYTGVEAGPLWQHWFVGDLPDLWPKALRQLEVFSGRAHPACHGAAQGLLGWVIAQERSETISAGREA